MTTRQLRPDIPKAVRKSVSMTQEMADDIQAQADKEGHGNFSAVIVRAVDRYLGFHAVTIDPRASEQERVA